MKKWKQELKIFYKFFIGQNPIQMRRRGEKYILYLGDFVLCVFFFLKIDEKYDIYFIKLSNDVYIFLVLEKK